MRNRKPRSISNCKIRMSVKYPAPKKLPCRIEIDYWHEGPKVHITASKNHRKFFYRYADATTDEDGWVDVKKWLPAPFDLMKMKTSKKECIGWWTGKDWEGLRLRENETVHYWKIYDDGERIWQ